MTTVFTTPTFTPTEQAAIDALDAGHVLTLDESGNLFTAYGDTRDYKTVSTAFVGNTLHTATGSIRYYHVQDTGAGIESDPLAATALLDAMHVLAPVSEWHTVPVAMR